MGDRKLILVEGTDDKHVMLHLFRNRGIRAIIEVQSHDGVERLLESLSVRLKACEDGDVVGVIIDADVDLNARWQSLRDRLRSVGYVNLPANPSPGGTILERPGVGLLPRVGFWVMPDNRTGGMLEDFLRFLVPSESRLLEHVRRSIHEIPKPEIRFANAALPKVLICTWLAWQSDPGLPYGTAVTARFLDPDVPQVTELMDWVKRLFNL